MKIYGPYKRKDGRLHLVIVHEGRKTTMSYPRWVMEQHLGRELLRKETVDHIDENPLNNEISNLRLLSISENIKIYNKNHPCKKVTLPCLHCKKLITRREKRVEYDLNVRKNLGIFCSKKCIGKYFNP